MTTKVLKIAAMAALMLVAMTTGQSQNVPITLEQGWNWISYPRSESMSINEALSGFTPSEGDVLKSQTGMAQYQGGVWIGDLTTLTPGKGYMYQSADGSTKSFVFGGEANDPSALPNEALEGEFTIDANGTKVRFSPGNLQCRIDPNMENQLQVGSGTGTTGYMPYYTWYCYSLCQMFYKPSELTAAGLSAGPITGIAFESYSTYHYQRDNIKIWMKNTGLNFSPSTSGNTSEMTQVFNGSVTQQTGWTEIPFNSNPFIWDGTSNVMVTVVMNHGSYNSSTSWVSNNAGFTCCGYTYNDSSPYDPSSSTYSINTTDSRPNTRFLGHGGVVWSFAQSQQDFVGTDNENISPTYQSLIDLFGWGTSGHPHGTTCYQPWSTSLTNSDYQAYGDASYNLYDQNGEADWGCNAIANGGNQPRQWRTLTKEEWTYMFITRSTPSGKRFPNAEVRGVNGMILLPDNWNTSYYSLNNTNNANAAFTSNVISSPEWQTLEQLGAVFLPAAGARYGNTIVSYNTTGGYWSSSRYNDGYAYYVDLSGVGTQTYMSRGYGLSVRLVCESNPRIRVLGVTGVSATTATVNAELDYTGSATVTERGVCWNYRGVPTVSDSHLSSGTGTGSFSVQMTGLASGTTYHVRAYAKIGDTYRYGNDVSFTTSSQLTVTTATVTGITPSYALCGGTVNDCDQTVTARGLCWGTNSNPTIDGSHSYDGSGTGSFTGIMTNLASNTTYYVRAYATTAEGTVYGTQRNFTTMSGVIDVTTAAVTDITVNSAICGGTVENNGGAAITARGVCWSINATPTVYDNCTINGSGTGSFTSTIPYLAPGTTYHVRAYATTANGTYYGNEQIFTTLSGGPTMSISSVTNIMVTAAVVNTTMTSNGGSTVTEFGVCWSRFHNPTISGDHMGLSFYDTGGFFWPIQGLMANTIYYVKAYAINAQGTHYTDEVSFQTHPAPPTGALCGTFTINSNGDKVRFSQGNLQYIGSASSPSWQFAQYQWEYLGTTTGQNSSSQNVDRDLFGWGTSGYNHGAVCYQPWSTSSTSSNYYAYGNAQYNLYDQTGKADWGYNPISNGGNQANQWRTLTAEEWEYIFNTRTTNTGERYFKAKVNGVNGVVLLPDEWIVFHEHSHANDPTASFSSETFTSTEWPFFELYGAVFLPAAGYRDGTTIHNEGSYGLYWSSSCYNSEIAYLLNFSGSSLSPQYGVYRKGGLSVRLVRSAQ